MKNARNRGFKTFEEFEVSLSDFGILAAKLEIVEKNEDESRFIGQLPSASFGEFMELWGRLHRHYLRFGARDKAA